MNLSERVETWRLKGNLVDFRGHSIHTFHQDGEGPMVVLLHGFPTSSYDWRYLVERMPNRAILAFDVGIEPLFQQFEDLFELCLLVGHGWHGSFTFLVLSRPMPAGSCHGTAVGLVYGARGLHGSGRIFLRGVSCNCFFNFRLGVILGERFVDQSGHFDGVLHALVLHELDGGDESRTHPLAEFRLHEPGRALQGVHADILLPFGAHDRHVHLGVLHVAGHFGTSHRHHFDARVAQFEQDGLAGHLSNNFGNSC